MSFALVIVGASWGGLDALSVFVKGLPRDFETPVAIVQHLSKANDSLLPELLQHHTSLTICEIEDKQLIRPRHIFIAPPDYHLMIDDGYFSLSVDAPVRYSRPSIDVALQSAADVYRARVIGVVLTGANEDGSKGLRHIVNCGGRAIVQDPSTAEIATMPAAALRLVPEAVKLPLGEIAPHVALMIREDAARAAARAS